jgi:hypothetical protein
LDEAGDNAMDEPGDNAIDNQNQGVDRNQRLVNFDILFQIIC